MFRSSQNLIRHVGRSFCTQAPDRLYKEIIMEIKAHQPAVLKSYSWFITKAASELSIHVSEVDTEPKPHIMRKTLLKSAANHSKHRAQYEIRTYYSKVRVARLTGSTSDTFLEYVQRFLPEGVSMKVTKSELLNFPDKVQASVDENIEKVIANQQL
ncbi:RP-S10 [Lepeophtheirus salmonis]|uniref:Small ribosomal subunit protein uS10m n=1 Tax=Lepeophtheirus salmonis TaxID=72036 RepID=A0A0K2V554_LEPSM|nr:probable 28S ribosomal protein S10, mitochondrial [Lepeophtheirus salmonis]CAB4063067.1 RP-S10 [Lepeophtheirus salmonis]CAF2916448.1 RP-S10 [Lepeophtheirus salmonis]